MKRGRNQRRRQGMNINRALDSNGPDVRIRGTANQIYDKYLALARDASSSGDRVKAENYLQHAEHYFRVIRALQPAQTPQGEATDADGEQPTIGGDERFHRHENGGERREGGDEEGEGYEPQADRGDRQPGGDRPPREDRAREDRPQRDDRAGGDRQGLERTLGGRSEEREDRQGDRQAGDRQPREGGERFANGGQHQGHGGEGGGERRGRRRRPRRPHQAEGGDNAPADQDSDESESVETAAE